MTKKCKHGKYFTPPDKKGSRWVSWYNQIDNEWEKCICGKYNYHPLPDFEKRVIIEDAEDLGAEEGVRCIEKEVDIHYSLLTEQQKQIMGMKREGYTQEEIAQELGVNQSSISKALKRAGHILAS